MKLINYSYETLEALEHFARTYFRYNDHLLIQIFCGSFDKLKIIEGICDFNKEQFIITNINKEKCWSENEFNNIFERTKHILNKEVMSNI